MWRGSKRCSNAGCRLLGWSALPPPSSPHTLQNQTQQIPSSGAGGMCDGALAVPVVWSSKGSLSHRATLLRASLSHGHGRAACGECGQSPSAQEWGIHPPWPGLTWPVLPSPRPPPHQSGWAKVVFAARQTAACAFCHQLFVKTEQATCGGRGPRPGPSPSGPSALPQVQSLPSPALSPSWRGDWPSTASDMRAELRAFPASRLMPGRASSCTCRGGEKGKVTPACLPVRPPSLGLQ